MKNRICHFGYFAIPVSMLLFSCTQSDETRKPNIIYILADDLGRAELGCYGQEIIETPNIDRLASEGMRFTNHYSGQAVSGPSRCSLFTGLHSGHAYIRGNDEMTSRGDVWNHAAMLADSSLEGQRPVPANTIMIPRKMKEAGYKTACIGKWGLGYPGSESTPNKWDLISSTDTTVRDRPIRIILLSVQKRMPGVSGKQTASTAYQTRQGSRSL